jgi:DNA-binding GntR family transcriptional regulator
MPIPDGARTARRPPARVLALEQLQQWIEDGTLQPGEVLRDSEVANKLGVSRTPVREAFQRLGEIGLLVTTTNSHTQVAPATPQDVASLYVTLAALHATSVELAITALEPGDLRRLGELNESMLEAVTGEDPGAASQADESFHGLVLDRADNPFLLRVTDWLTVHARRLNTLYFSHHGPSESSYQDHAEIIDALRAGDAARAASVTRRNMLRTVDVLHPRAVSLGDQR